VTKGEITMKKIVSIVVTTGLLLGAVSFSALACDPGRGPERFQEPKRVEQHERYQPPREARHHQAPIMVNGKAQKPVPASAPMVRKAGPGPEEGHRFMPKPAPERPECECQPSPERPGPDGQFRW
jgi:hypothetical protein